MIPPVIFLTFRPWLAAVFLFAISASILIADPINQAQLVTANNQFAFDLMQQVANTQSNANVFLSPFSVSTALQLVDNGAAGKTKTELQQVLHTTGLADDALNASFQSLNQSLTSHPEVTLTLANGMWVRPGLQLKPQFVAENQKFFQAELAEVDFNQPAAAQTINDWASQQTHGKIPQVVQFPFSPDLRMILANAIYFKGKWVSPFDKKLTAPHDFHLPDGTVASTAMMSLRRQLSYAETPTYQAVQLPYAGGLRMEVFLPTAGQTPLSLLRAFGESETWPKQIEPAFHNREGTLLLPKFKMDFSVLLNDPLQALGLKSAFGPGADFSGMASEPLFISEVRQKSYVEVNEEGTEAAAVTTIHVHRMAVLMNPQPPFEMIVDRPFLFVIQDNATGSILFTGIVNHPVSGSGKQTKAASILKRFSRYLLAQKS